MQKILKSFLLLICAGVLFTSCYSVFQGGTGGIVVDSESTSNPKSGIANVDIYAYTDSGARDSDFKNWKEGSVFKPTSSYYGHTTTGVDGSFVLSKLIWKSFNPTFGKDADVTHIYFNFYHEEYGLTKGETIIVSDDAAQTVYAELTKTRKTLPLTLEFKDVKDNSQASATVEVEITVPQTNGKITDVPAKTYKTTVTGTGTVAISYPRYKYDASGTESNNTPEITIAYYQASEDVSWKACYNQDNEAKNFAFRDLSADSVKKEIPDFSSYKVVLYGKANKIAYPTFTGVYHSDGSELGKEADDGKIMHGNFTITSNESFVDNEYTENTVSRNVKFCVDGVEKTLSISSDKSSYYVTLN